jgi:phage-related protein
VDWSVETVAAADSEIAALPTKLRARLLRLLVMVESVGLDQLREPHVRHLEGKLWELRTKSRDGIARGIYVTATGRRVVVLHVFAKRSRRTPRQALATAKGRMKTVVAWQS